MNNQQIRIESQLKNTAKTSQLQSLNLEQLNDVAGGPLEKFERTKIHVNVGSRAYP